MTGLDAARTAYSDLLDVTDSLDDDAGWRPTALPGWTVRDLVFHLLSDAQRALVALGTPTRAVPDVDAVSYWRNWQPGTAGANAGLRSTRIMASCWTSVVPIAALYGETARAVRETAARCDTDMVVMTQGHALRVDDLLTTLAIEAAIHHLDLVATWDRPGPSTSSLVVVRDVLDALLERPVPLSWDSGRWTLVATGRAAPSEDERAWLGADIERLPLFG